MRYMLIMVLIPQVSYSMVRAVRRVAPAYTRKLAGNVLFSTDTSDTRKKTQKKSDLVRQAQLIDMHARLRGMEDRKKKPSNFFSLLSGMGLYSALTYGANKLGIPHDYAVGSSIFGAAMCTGLLRTINNAFHYNKKAKELKKEIEKFEKSFDDD